MTCIATPISWLRLEQFDGSDAEIAAHVAACPACAACLDEIRRDVVALPPLVVPERKRRAWWWFALPALAAAAVAFVVWPRDPEREDVVRVKGVGEVVLDVVRERDGVIRDDVRTFLPGDRWKIVVTCPPAASAWVEVDVGGDRPLAPSTIRCGNRVVLSGAFHLTGDAPNRVCIRVGEHGPDGTACVVIRPE